MRKSLLALAAVAGISFAAGTANAGWVVTGTNEGPAPGNNAFQTELTGYDLFTSITSLSFDVPVTGFEFFYVGAESGFNNTFTFDANSFTETDSFANLFAAPVSIGSTAAIPTMSFTSPEGTFGLGTAEFGIFFNAATPNVIYLALDDDGNGPDDNHDDIVIRVVASPTDVPEPAILALLGAGLLGTGFAARRRRNS